METNIFVSYRNDSDTTGQYSRLNGQAKGILRQFVDDTGKYYYGDDETREILMFSKRPQAVTEEYSDIKTETPDVIRWETSDTMWLVPLKFSAGIQYEKIIGGLLPDTFTRLYLMVKADSTTQFDPNIAHYKFEFDVSKILKTVSVLVASQRFVTQHSIRAAVILTGILLKPTPSNKLRVDIQFQLIHNNDPVDRYDGIFYSIYMKLYQEKAYVTNHYVDSYPGNADSDICHLITKKDSSTNTEKQTLMRKIKRAFTSSKSFK